MPVSNSAGYSNQWLEREPGHQAPTAGPGSEPEPPVSPAQRSEVGSQAEIRRWAKLNGLPVSDTGRIRQDVIDAYREVFGG